MGNPNTKNESRIPTQAGRSTPTLFFLRVMLLPLLRVVLPFPSSFQCVMLLFLLSPFGSCCRSLISFFLPSLCWGWLSDWWFLRKEKEDQPQLLLLCAACSLCRFSPLPPPLKVLPPTSIWWVVLPFLATGLFELSCGDCQGHEFVHCCCWVFT